MDKHVALLRGINVGGKNLIKMTELKACFEDQGFEDVMTYIQSGNVIFISKGFGARSEAFRYDVLFLKEPLTASAALKSLRTKPGVDEVQPGQGVLYFKRMISKASQSHLSKLASMPVYQQMTIRNWNTTSKLLELMSSYQR